MTGGKTICVVAKQTAPPAFIAALADRDTASCKPGARAQQAQATVNAPLAPPAWLRLPAPPLPLPPWFRPPILKRIIGIPGVTVTPEVPQP